MYLKATQTLGKESAGGPRSGSYNTRKSVDLHGTPTQRKEEGNSNQTSPQEGHYHSEMGSPGSPGWRPRKELCGVGRSRHVGCGRDRLWGTPFESSFLSATVDSLSVRRLGGAMPALALGGPRLGRGRGRQSSRRGGRRRGPCRRYRRSSIASDPDWCWVRSSLHLGFKRGGFLCHVGYSLGVTHLISEGIILEVLAHYQGKHESDQYIGATQPPRQASKSRED